MEGGRGRGREKKRTVRMQQAVVGGRRFSLGVGGVTKPEHGEADGRKGVAWQTLAQQKPPTQFHVVWLISLARGGHNEH